MIIEPYAVFRYGVHSALEVERGAAARVRDALATLVRYGAGEELDAVVLELTPSSPPPSALLGPGSGGGLVALLREALAAPGAVDIGVGLWSNMWTFDDDTPAASGADLVDTSAGVSARWLEVQPYVPGRLSAASELLAAGLGGFDEDEARRYIVHAILEPHEDDLQPEDIDETHVAALDDDGRNTLARALEEWRAGFSRAHGRYRRELEAVARATDLVLVWDEENMAL